MRLPAILVVACATILVCAALFCLQGFLATFEPTTSTTTFLVFRLIWAILGTASLVVAVALVARLARSRRAT
jgi:MFS family permease